MTLPLLTSFELVALFVMVQGRHILCTRRILAFCFALRLTFRCSGIQYLEHGMQLQWHLGHRCGRWNMAECSTG